MRVHSSSIDRKQNIYKHFFTNGENFVFMGQHSPPPFYLFSFASVIVTETQSRKGIYPKTNYKIRLPSSQKTFAIERADFLLRCSPADPKHFAKCVDSLAPAEWMTHVGPALDACLSTDREYRP